MTKNVYQGIFQNYTCFTVYGVFICFMHNRVLTTFSTDWTLDIYYEFTLNQFQTGLDSAQTLMWTKSVAHLCRLTLEFGIHVKVNLQHP